MMGLVASLAASYLVGALPTGYLLVKWTRHLDVRTVGSGNVGATNVTRAAGKGWGLIVLLLDIAKGALATVGLARWGVPAATPAVQLACGLAAVLGHNFPVFLKFRGGKGVATTLGVVCTVNPIVGLACAGMWLATFLGTRHVSVASMAAAATIPLAQLLGNRPAGEVLLGIMLALLIVARHRANIERLLRGTEPTLHK